MVDWDNDSSCIQRCVYGNGLLLGGPSERELVLIISLYNGTDHIQYPHFRADSVLEAISHRMFEFVSWIRD
jgi:hypothetical protein